MATAAGSGPHLELYHDSKHTSSFNLAGASSWTIGRSLECSVVINHPSVSRLHARIYEEDGGFYLTDMGSTHGTRLAEQALEPKQPVRLVDGVRVSIGSTERSLVPRGMLAQMLEAARAAAARQQAEEAARRRRRRPPPPTTTRLRRAARAAHAEGAALLAGGLGGSRRRRPRRRRRRGRAGGWGFARLWEGGDPGRRAYERGGAAVAGAKGRRTRVSRWRPSSAPASTSPPRRRRSSRCRAEGGKAAEEAASAAAKKQAAAPKVIGAMAPAAGPAGLGRGGGGGGAAAAPGVSDAMVGPPMPPAGAGATTPRLSARRCRPWGHRCGRGRAGAAAAARGGGRRWLRSGRPQQRVMPSGGGGGGGGGERGDGDDDDDDEPAVRLPVSHRRRRRLIPSA